MDPKIFNYYQKLIADKEYFTRLALNALPHQLHFAQQENAWNMLQVLDHLVQVEKATLHFIKHFDFNRKNEKTKLKSKFNYLSLTLALRSPFKFKVPVADLHPKVKPLESVLQEWEEVRLDFQNFLETFPVEKLKYFVFFHPIAGKLNILQTLGFLHYHMVHHQFQLKNILQNPGFPTSRHNKEN